MLGMKIKKKKRRKRKQSAEWWVKRDLPHLTMQEIWRRCSVILMLDVKRPFIVKTALSLLHILRFLAVN